MKNAKYFFSYARNDSDFVLKLAMELRAAGVSLWLDQLDIVGGQRWDRAVEESLRTCDGMIVILSPDSVASDNVMDEVSYALEEQKLVIPVLYRVCTFPFRLRRLQHIDFTGDYKGGFMKLLIALGIRSPSQNTESNLSGRSFSEDVIQSSKNTPEVAQIINQPPNVAETYEPEEAVGNKAPNLSTNLASVATKEVPASNKKRPIKLKYILFIYVVCLLWGGYIAWHDSAPEKVFNLFLLATALSIVYVIATRIVAALQRNTN